MDETPSGRVRRDPELDGFLDPEITLATIWRLRLRDLDAVRESLNYCFNLTDSPNAPRLIFQKYAVGKLYVTTEPPPSMSTPSSEKPVRGDGV